MRDRIPTQVLDNGAVRMEQFDANGNSLGYVYLKRADEPIEVGTPYNVNNVLTDATASALGIESGNPTPNEAFAKIASVMRTRTVFETIYTETMSPTTSVVRTLDVDLLQYERLLIDYEYDESVTSLARVTAKIGDTKIGTDGHNSVDNGLGMIYFDNSSPIKLRSAVSLGAENIIIHYIQPAYIPNMSNGNQFSLTCDKSTVKIKKITIYGEKAVLGA